jgi:hypothetical protein
MEGLKTAIPQRLYFIRIVVTIGLFFSFYLSFNLWGTDHFFPGLPVLRNLDIAGPWHYTLVIASSVLLLGSLVFYKTRLFIFLSLLINLFMVLLDMNRLQPWFYIYNAVLFVFLFYDGRVDNPNKFISVFVFIQLIVASVYVYNGLNQLMNPLFVVSDFYDVILPLKKVMSERQFLFFLKMGKVVPFIPISIGVGLLVRPVKYLAISLAAAMHVFLFILLFPSAGNSNYALWFMNLVFGLMIFFLFSGETRQRYFSPTVLLSRPLFYIIIGAFWIMPAFPGLKIWPESLCFNFKSGIAATRNIAVTQSDYNNMPYYIKAFCVKGSKSYMLDVNRWCAHELNAEYYDHDRFTNSSFSKGIQLVVVPQLPETELSAR